MDPKVRNLLAFLVLAALVAGSLWALLPFKEPDRLDYATTTDDGTPVVESIRLDESPMVIGPAGVIAEGEETTSTITLERRKGTEVDALSDWWVTASTGQTGYEGGAFVGETQLPYGVVVAVGGRNYSFEAGATSITQGLDIRGGLSVILAAKPLGAAPLTEDAVSRVETILIERVNGFGVNEASVQRQGTSAFLVQLPGIKDARGALELLGEPGKLEFVDLSSIADSATIDLILAQIEADRSGLTTDLPRLDPNTYKPFMTGEVITSAQVTTDEIGNPAVSLTMNKQGADTWAGVTTRLAQTKGQVGIFLDGVAKSVPAVQEPILTGDTRISGSFTIDEAKRLAAVLQSGAMPATIDIDEAQVVDATLGSQSLSQGLLAGLIGLAFVAVFMAVYYRALGVLSWVSLAVYGVILFGIFGVLSKAGIFSLTLPGIAGIILTIGVAADTSILIFERLKEEVDAGKTYRSAAKSGVRHAIGTSIDADVVTLVSAVALYALAIGPVRGFAFTLILGIIVDLVVAILFTGPVVRILAEGWMPRLPALFGVKAGDGRA